MASVVTIPRKEYEFLRECARILYKDAKNQFRPDFLRRLRQAQADVAAGKGRRFADKKAMLGFLDSL